MARQPRPASNGFDPDKLKGYVDHVENAETELASEKGKFMRECQGYRKAINDILGEAKDDGIPKKELKAVLKTRRVTRQLEAIRDGLEGESQETYDQIRHALGDLADLPLGQPALADAAANGKSPDFPAQPAA